MTDISKLANIPLAKPGFDTLGMSAPTIVQLNPGGKWENQKPESLDEERLRAVVQHLVNTNALQAAQSYCMQCADENKLPGVQASNYVPVIMMPIYPADQCPFDMNCEIQKIESAKPSKGKKKAESAKDEHKDDGQKPKEKVKKRGFVLQRLTDFDLISQW